MHRRGLSREQAEIVLLHASGRLDAALINTKEPQ